MQISVNFDLILVAIFTTIFITGYIRGGGIELLRVLKVVIPFFVLYFYGDNITNLLFSSNTIVNFVYTILPNIPYRNSIASLSTSIGVYIVVYFFLAIFLWRLGKYVLDERIEYMFGRFNSIFGGVFSVIRMYIIISVFIIPFYALNFTNNNDILTSFILNHPPKFSRFGILLEETKPTIDKFNEVSRSLKIMDIKSLEKYTDLLSDVDVFMEENENESYEIYLYLQQKDKISGNYEKDEFLYYYVKHLKYFEEMDFEDLEIKKINEDLLKTASEYEQIFIWAYENKIKDMDSIDQVINSFIENYPKIAANTDDQLTLEVLKKMQLNTQVYLVMKNWLMDSYQIELKSNFDLLNDDNLELILNDFSSHKENLINEIKKIDAKESEKALIIKQVERFSHFQEDYLLNLKPQIELYEPLLDRVSFKYKLVFSIMKEEGLNKVVDENVNNDPIMYLLFLDSLSFIDYFNDDDVDIYYQVGQIYFALFMLDINTFDKIITYDEIITHINRFTYNEELYKRTSNDINKVLKALLIERNDEKSYLEYIVESNYAEGDLIEKLTNSKDIQEALNYENTLLLKSINRKLLSN